MWTSDGTAVGTARLTDITPNTESWKPILLGGLNGKMMFRSYLGLWRTDGTADGTVKIYGEIAGGIGGEGPTHLVIGGTMYFNGWDHFDSSTNYLDATDGTPEGTKKVDTASYAPTGMTDFGGRLLFTSMTASDPYLLSSGGPVRLADLCYQGFSATPGPYAVAGAVAYFAADDCITGRELWRTDGTPAGTSRVADINYGPGGSNPEAITTFHGIAYFNATSDGTHRALWRSDGTTAGTYPAAPQIGAVGQIFVANGRLYVKGQGMWVSDGMSFSPVPATDPLPWGWTSFRDSGLYSGSDGAGRTGLFLWAGMAKPPAPTTPVVSDSATTPKASAPSSPRITMPARVSADRLPRGLTITLSRLKARSRVVLRVRVGTKTLAVITKKADSRGNLLLGFKLSSRRAAALRNKRLALRFAVTGDDGGRRVLVKTLRVTA